VKLVPRHGGWALYVYVRVNFTSVHFTGGAYKRDLTNDSLMGYRHWLKHTDLRPT